MRGIAHAGAPALDAQLEQHLQALAAGEKEAAELVDQLGRIDQAEEFEIGIAQQVGDDLHIAPPHQLVGHQHAPDPVRMGGGGLLRGGQRDTPGAGLELPGEQLGRHRGLAVRCELHAVFVHEPAHPGEVMGQPAFVQHGGRQAQLLFQQPPAGGGLGRCQRRL